LRSAPIRGKKLKISPPDLRVSVQDLVAPN